MERTGALLVTLTKLDDVDKGHKLLEDSSYWEIQFYLEFSEKRSISEFELPVIIVIFGVAHSALVPFR